MKKKLAIGLVVFSLISFLILAVHNVSRSISDEDKNYIEQLLVQSGLDIDDLKNSGDFDDQIADIRAVQNVVIDYSDYQKPIPAYQSREPKDFFEAKSVNCFDRGRFLDKAFRMLGYDARYVAVFSTAKTGSVFKTLITKNRNVVRSHVLLEIKTVKGWVALDTVEKWIALNKEGEVYDAKQLEEVLPHGNTKWDNKVENYWLLNDPFITIYGLYSRHGKYYAPYNFIPDVNWSELCQNF